MMPLLHLYFMHNPYTQLIKIGVSYDPKQRCRELSLVSGVQLTLLGVLRGGDFYERELHLAFHETRELGEWFQPTELLEALAANPRKVSVWLKANADRVEHGRQQVIAARMDLMRQRGTINNAAKAKTKIRKEKERRLRIAV